MILNKNEKKCNLYNISICINNVLFANLVTYIIRRIDVSKVCTKM